MMNGPEKSDPVIVATKLANSRTALRGEICERALRSGAGGAKGGDQGKCGTAKHAPDTEPGRRVTGAGPHTESDSLRRHTPEVGEAMGLAAEVMATFIVHTN